VSRYLYIYPCMVLVYIKFKDGNTNLCLPPTIPNWVSSKLQTFIEVGLARKVGFLSLFPSKTQRCRICKQQSSYISIYKNCHVRQAYTNNLKKIYCHEDLETHNFYENQRSGMYAIRPGENFQWILPLLYSPIWILHKLIYFLIGKVRMVAGSSPTSIWRDPFFFFLIIIC
jgi:hypothetical protein